MLKQACYSVVKGLLKRPIYLIFFITNKCNAKCGHCFYSQNLNLNERKDLSLEEIEQFSRQLGKIMWLDFSGGEPFLRGDIDRIYEIFVRNNKVESFSCPTNGILTQRIAEKTRKMLEQELSAKEFNITLSLDGLEEMHNHFRGIGCFKNVLATYDALAEIKKVYPKLNIKMSTTLSNQNIGQIRLLNDFVKKRMPAVSFHNFEILRGTPKSCDFKTPSIQELEDAKKDLFGVWESYSMFGNSMSSKIALNAKKRLFNEYLKILGGGRQPFRCYAGKVHCVLDNNGDIYMCELLGKIGNIREKSFEKIWESSEAKCLRQHIKDRKCTCTHSCFQNTNIIFNQALWPDILFGGSK